MHTIRIKKWICMLVLIIISVITVNDVHAVNYIADDNYNMSSQYHDIFNNYFTDDTSYQYFSYECIYGNSDRHCYYGINSKNEYLNIIYKNNGYNSWIVDYQTGIDEDFSVIGSNIYKKNINPQYILIFGLIFVWLIFLIKELAD